MSAGIYKQSVTTVTKLVILQNSVRKIYPLKPALNKLSHAHRP